MSRDFSLHILQRRVASAKTKACKKNGFGFVVDPSNEATQVSTSAASPSNFLVDLVTTLRSKISPDWKGVAGNDHVPVASEYQRLLSSSSGFVYFGFCRFLSEFDPASLSALQCSNVSFVHLADRLVNIPSYKRQNVLDNPKTEPRRALESPFNTAALLTLRGVDAILLNQYSVAPDLATAMFATFWQGFANISMSGNVAPAKSSGKGKDAASDATNALSLIHI